MKTVFSTNNLHARDRFDFWHGVACKNLVDHDSLPECRPTFHAQIETGNLGNLELVLFHNSPMQVSHTARHIAHVKSDHLFVCRQIAGRVLFEQDTREIALEAGDVALLDPLLPYEGSFSADSETLVLKVPRRELEARVGKTRDMVARSIKPVRTEDRLMSSLSAMLPSLAGKMNSISEEMVGNHTLDLLAVSLAKTMEADRPRVSSAKALVLLNIRSVIEVRLRDPSLGAQAVADAVGVSVRYANAVLADHDTSIMRLIQARRLARCRYALEDPNQAHRTVSEIAYGWGFSDMTHFGRRFKKAYGILPSEYQTIARRTGRGSQF
ncbi:helix-turn-helix domain-containing protein [Bradyrhizobium sp.]|jgi:AraC family transcriptional activator of tynA and feaB|uniref:AraC-like ligand-binding domain-containing protein n=1 Tax=Bradyrhizobium sp. TaxID=376 RepID=UPI003C1C996A